MNPYDQFGVAGDEQATSGNPYDKFGVAEDEAPEQPAAASEDNPTWGDYGRMVMQGGAQAGQGVGWLMERMGGAGGIAGTALRVAGVDTDALAKRAGGAVKDVSRDAASYWGQGVSEQAQRALQTDFTGEGKFGDKWNKAKLVAAQSLLGTMAGMGAGGAAAKGLTVLGMGGKAAAAVGYGAGEAAVAAPTAGAQTEDQVLGMTHDQLMQSPEYQAAYESYSSLPEDQRQQKSKQLVASAASGDAAAITALSTFVLSAPFSNVIGKAAHVIPGKGAIGGTVRGAAEEATQEFAQSGAEQLAQNYAIKENADPSQDMLDGVLEQATGGAIGGALMGGPLGAVSGDSQEKVNGPMADIAGKAEKPKPTVEQIETEHARARQAMKAMGGDQLDQVLAGEFATANLTGAFDQQVHKEKNLAARRESVLAERMKASAEQQVTLKEAERGKEALRKEQAKGDAERKKAAVEGEKLGREFGDEAAMTIMQRRKDYAALAEETALNGVKTPQQAAEEEMNQEAARIVDAPKAAAQAYGTATQAFDQRDAQIEKERDAIGRQSTLARENTAALADIAQPTVEPARLGDVAPASLKARRDAARITPSPVPTKAQAEEAKAKAKEKPVPAPSLLPPRETAQAPSESAQASPESSQFANREQPGNSSTSSEQVVDDSRQVAELGARAHEAAPSPKNERPEPTEAQIKAGNYKKGHIRLHGLDISVENPKGSNRSGTSPDGKPWTRRLRDHYGYIRGTKGADGDHLDVLIGEHPSSDKIYVVDQVKQDGSGFDEHKLLAAYPNEAEAVKAYKRNYPADWQVGPVTEMSIQEFNDWKKGDTTKPLKPIPQAATPATAEQVQEQRQRATFKGRREEKVRYRPGDNVLSFEKGAQAKESREAQEMSAAVDRGLIPHETAKVKALHNEYLEARDKVPPRERDTVSQSHIDESIDDVANAKTVEDMRVALQGLTHNLQEGIRHSKANLERSGRRYRPEEKPATLKDRRAKVEMRDEPRGTTVYVKGQAVATYPDKAAAQADAGDLVESAPDKGPLPDLPDALRPKFVNKPSELPEDLRNQMVADGMIANGKIKARGVYDVDSDTVYAFPGNHATDAELLSTVLHETIAHKGLRSLLGDDMPPLLKDVFKNGDQELMADVAAQHGLDMAKEADQEVVAEEYIAHMAESNIDASLLQKVIDAVRKALRAVGWVKEWTDKDIKALLRAARTSLMKKGRGHPKGGVRYSRGPIEKAKGPLAQVAKLKATWQDQANYNPGMVRRAVDFTKSKAQNSIETLLGAIPREYLKDFFAPGKMSAISEYIAMADRMDGRRNELMIPTEEIAKRWLKYTKAKDKQHLLGDLMHAATLAQVDPSKPFEPIRPEGKMSLQEKRENAVRSEKYAILKEHYEKLDAEGKELFDQVRNTYESHRVKVLAALTARVNDSEADGKTKAKLIDQLRDKFESGRIRGPYFPLVRNGDYWAVAKQGGKEGETVAFSRFTDAHEQRAWLASMRAEGHWVDGGKKMDNASMMQNIDPEFVSKTTKLAEKVSPDLAEDIWQLYLRLMPEMSMRKHFIHRKGRLGFSADALQAFGQTMFHGAHQLAKLEYMHKLDGLIKEADKQARELEQKHVQGDKSAHDATWAAPMVKELKARHEWARNPKTTAAATNLTALGFAWYLGGSLASMLVNYTQTMIVGLPVLAGEHNLLGASKELLRAAKQYATSRGPLGNRLRGDERAAWDEGRRVGLFDQTLAHDLAGTAEKGIDYTSRWHQVSEVLSFAFHKAEEFNRQVTYMAAYRLGRTKGLSHEDAMVKGAALTKTSHFNYANTNRPRYMQHDAAKVLFLFRQYALNMTYRMARDINDSLRGATPELRRAARTRFGGMMMMTALFGGTTGLPTLLTGPIKFILESIFSSDDDPWDADDALRVYLTDMFSAKTAEAITKGPVDAFAGVTMSSRVGLNNLWFRSAPANLEGDALYAYWLKEAVGPVPAIAGSVIEGSMLKSQGFDDKAAEKVVPTFLSNFMKAHRFYTEGATNNRGDAILTPEEFSTADIVRQAIGFTPAKLTLQYEQNRMIKNAESDVNKGRQDLIDKWFQARQGGDEHEILEARVKINDWNAKLTGKPISVANLMASVKSRARYSNQARHGITVDRKLNRLYDEKRITDEEPE